MTTPIDTAALKALLAKATPGPLALASGHDAANHDHIEPIGAKLVKLGDQPNAALIVAAINALPALLEAAEDRERMDWLEVNVAAVEIADWKQRQVLRRRLRDGRGNNLAEAATFRAAIDAARKEPR